MSDAGLVRELERMCEICGWARARAKVDARRTGGVDVDVLELDLDAEMGLDMWLDRVHQRSKPFNTLTRIHPK